MPGASPDRDMNQYKEIILLILALTVWTSAHASGDIREPSRPKVDMMFDDRKEAGINKLAGLSAQEVFENLKNAEYLLNTDLMYKAIYKSFYSRKQAALNLAVRYLRSPLTEVIGGKPVSRLKDFTVAKRIFETFPEDAVIILVPLYDRSDEVTRANILQAAGKLAGGQQTRELFMRALNDRAAYEDENPDSSGRPMRICDMAYNQLVLRYNIRNVLRTISPSHALQTRDYHIGILKGLLS